MERFRRASTLAIVVSFGLTALVFVFQAARSSEPGTFSDDVCLDCHEDEAHAMGGTAHDPAAGKIVSCLGCHAGPDTEKHAEDPDTYRPVNPAALPSDSTTAVCVACHADPHALNLLERDPHGDAEMSCNACHRVHANQHASLLKEEGNKLCLGCHALARSGFAMPSHHPVEEGIVACRDCHIEVAQGRKQRAAGGPGETCVKCHGSFQGPFPYEHEAAVNYSVNEGGCLNCHAPHGSVFPMLFKQSYESPHFSLCSQCHSVPKHLNNVNHGTQWAGVPCGECHVDVHGSYTSRHLLDPALQSQGCFVAGCHQM